MNDQFHRITEIKLQQDISPVRIHRILRDEQLGRYLVAVQAIDQFPNDIQFTLAELIQFLLQIQRVRIQTTIQ